MNLLDNSVQWFDLVVLALYIGVIGYTVPIWFRANGTRPSVTFVLGITAILGVGAGLGTARIESMIYPVIRLSALLWILVYVVRLARWHPNPKSESGKEN